MLDFEKELERYQPSLEIDQAEEAIYKSDLTDMSDILDKILNGTPEKQADPYDRRKK